MMMMVRSLWVFVGLAWLLSISSSSQQQHHQQLFTSVVVEAFSVQSHNSYRSSSSFLGTKNTVAHRLFRPTTVPSTSPATITSTTSLSMHMGHSHSHHTHLHSDDNHNHNHAQQQPSATTTKNNRFTKVKTLRHVAMFLFCAIVTLGPSAILRRNVNIRRVDFAAFCLTFCTFFAFDEIRHGIKKYIFKLQRLRQGFMKHQPKTKLSLRQYLLENENAADRVTLLGVAINIVLSVSKFIVGVTSHSSALVADAGHSLSDLFSDFVTLYSVQIARLPPDDDHPYGHGKFEAIGSLFLALILLATGISVGANAYKELVQIISMEIQKSTAGASAIGLMTVKLPKAPALFMAGISIVSKEWLYRITHKVGESLNSQVVIANAWHHRSDAYSSILALFSIAIAMTVPGLVAADAAAGLLVAGMICMTGADIMGESINQLSDTSTNQELVNRVRTIARDHDDVLQVNRIRTRQVGSLAVVDVSVVTPEALSSSAIRTVEQRIRQRILEQLPHFVAEAEVRGTNYNPRLGLQQQPQLQQQKNGVENEALSGSDVQSSSGSDAIGSSSNIDIIDGQLPNEALKSATDSNQEVHSPLDCPLLVSMSIHGAADECPSASQVESTARELTMSSSFYPDTITAVQGVTVHYDDPLHAIVDVDIRVASQQQQQQQQQSESSDIDGAPTAMSVTSAQEVANKLRQRLEASPSIYKANIYLDLNIQQDDDDDDNDKNENNAIMANNGEIYSPPPAAVMSQSTTPQSTAPASAAVVTSATRDSIHSTD